MHSNPHTKSAMRTQHTPGTHSGITPREGNEELLRFVRAQQSPPALTSSAAFAYCLSVCLCYTIALG